MFQLWLRPRLRKEPALLQHFVQLTDGTASPALVRLLSRAVHSTILLKHRFVVFNYICRPLMDKVQLGTLDEAVECERALEQMSEARGHKFVLLHPVLQPSFEQFVSDAQSRWRSWQVRGLHLSSHASLKEGLFWCSPDGSHAACELLEFRRAVHTARQRSAPIELVFINACLSLQLAVALVCDATAGQVLDTAKESMGDLEERRGEEVRGKDDGNQDGDGDCSNSGNDYNDSDNDEDSDENDSDEQETTEQQHCVALPADAAAPAEASGLVVVCWATTVTDGACRLFMVEFYSRLEGTHCPLQAYDHSICALQATFGAACLCDPATSISGVGVPCLVATTALRVGADAFKTWSQFDERCRASLGDRQHVRRRIEGGLLLGLRISRLRSGTGRGERSSARPPNSGRGNITHEVSQYVTTIAKTLVKARILEGLSSLRDDVPGQYWQARARNSMHRALAPTLELATMFTRNYFKPDAIDRDKLPGHIDLDEFCRCLQGPVDRRPTKAFRRGAWTPAGLEVGCAEFERVHKGQGKETAEAILRFYGLWAATGPGHVGKYPPIALDLYPSILRGQL